jgi:tRNA threonylcarbamoyl adenosine modification protein (Sua5/YciO/YrdC/YwlC family)
VSELFDCTDPLLRERGLRYAATAIRRGELVVLPTDTVYGVAADAFTPAAVSALLAAKGRGRDMPVPVLVDSRAALDAVAVDLPEVGERLVEAFWPGALTIVVRHTAHLAWDLGDARGTVAVRMPSGELALELLASTGPLAVSSANRSGEAPAGSAGHARERLGEAVAVYLEAGPCPLGVASTIVDVTGTRPRLLRLGALSVERLRDAVPELDAGDAEPL